MMLKTRYMLASIAGTTAISLGAIGAASAAATHTNNGNIGTSGIPKSVFKQDKQSVVAQILNTTTAKVQSAHSHRDLKQRIAAAGLTKKTFNEKVKAQVTSELEVQGYTQSQVTIALQQKTINHLRHHNK